MAKNKKCKELNTRIPEGLVGTETPQVDPKLPLLPEIPIGEEARAWLTWMLDTATYLQAKAERGERAQIQHGHLHLSRLHKGRKLAHKDQRLVIEEVLKL